MAASALVQIRDNKYIVSLERPGGAIHPVVSPHSELSHIVSSFPLEVTSLFFSTYRMGEEKFDVAQLAQALPAISSDVTLLGFDLTCLDNPTQAEIERVFSAIPASVTSLCLYNPTGAELVHVFSVIPRWVTSVQMDRLRNLTRAELAQVFFTIPASMTSLVLMNSLSNLTGTEIAQVFSFIPISVTSLRSTDDINNRTRAELVQIFFAIPSGVRSFDFNLNCLSNLTTEELAPILSTLPARVTFLRICDSFKRVSGFALEQVFSAIPSWVTSLDLGYSLHYRTIAETKNILSAIPPSVRSLYFGNNFLNNRSNTDITELFSTLPSGVKFLGLGQNEWLNKEQDEIAQMFSALPSVVTSLDLRKNGGVTELVKMLSIIPSSVNSLYLDIESRFGKKNGKALTKIFSAIPVGVTSLHFDGTNLKPMNRAEITLAVSSIPPWVTSIDLSSNFFKGDTLFIVLITLPRTIKSIRLDGNELLKDLNLRLSDRYYQTLTAAVPHATLRLKNNGLSQVSRCLPFFLGTYRSATRRVFRREVLEYVFNYVAPENKGSMTPLFYYAIQQAPLLIDQFNDNELIVFLQSNPKSDVLERCQQRLDSKSERFTWLNLFILIEKLRVESFSLSPKEWSAVVSNVHELKRYALIFFSNHLRSENTEQARRGFKAMYERLENCKQHASSAWAAVFDSLLPIMKRINLMPAVVAGVRFFDQQQMESIGRTLNDNQSTEDSHKNSNAVI